MNDTTFIFLGLLSIGGSILITQLMQMNWFKRKDFLFKQSMKRKEYNINFKKLEKQLGVKDKPIKEEKSLLESVQGLDLNKIKGLIDMVQKTDDGEGGEYEEPNENNITDIIANVVNDNPEVVQKFLDGLGSKKSGETDQTYLGG